MNPANDIASYIQIAGLGVLGTNIFTGPVRPVSQHIPTNAIFILGTGGGPSTRIHTNKRELRYPEVQIRVRDHKYNNGCQRSIDCHDALEGAQIPNYWDIRTLQSSPIYIGQDENGNYEWSINIQCRYHT